MAKGSKASKSTPRPDGGYTVLARRYRSRDFDELIGQEPIARTLKNAIETGRTAHAYLFCGTRGVGKTSMARIFAKALNVDDSLAQKDEIASAILRGDDLDVIEIDGASNRGIADAKELIAGAGLSPARCRYKIYIIDEVHMLTREAFNALLKTMEEPPAHVKFILCTTEAHKVPQTIQSRCQRFDFRPIPTARIAEQLRHILEQEKIEADDDVVVHVAQLGNGSMRDALSLLDRLLAAGEDRLTASLLEQMIGLPDQALIVGLTAAIIEHDCKNALERGDELLKRGATVEQVLEMLAEHFRHLMIIATCGEASEVLEMSGEARQLAAEQARHFDAAALVHLIAICDAVARNARFSAAARAMFDSALVRMCLSEHLADIAAFLRGTSVPPAARRPVSATTGKKKELTRRAPETTSPRPAVTTTAVNAAKKPAGEESGAPAERSAQSASPAPADGPAMWAKVQEAASASESIRAKVEHLVFREFDGQVMRLGVDEHGAGIARYLRSQVDAIAGIIRSATGCAVRVEFEGEATSPVQVAADAVGLQDLPAIRKAMEIFDAVIVDVKDLPPQRTTPAQSPS